MTAHTQQSNIISLLTIVKHVNMMIIFLTMMKYFSQNMELNDVHICPGSWKRSMQLNRTRRNVAWSDVSHVHVRFMCSQTEWKWRVQEQAWQTWQTCEFIAKMHRNTSKNKRYTSALISISDTYFYSLHHVNQIELNNIEKKLEFSRLKYEGEDIEIS